MELHSQCVAVFQARHFQGHVHLGQDLHELHDVLLHHIRDAVQHLPGQETVQVLEKSHERASMGDHRFPRHVLLHRPAFSLAQMVQLHVHHGARGHQFHGDSYDTERYHGHSQCLRF